jgi:hypothetical protein
MCCKELKEVLGGEEKCFSNSTVAKENGREFRLNLGAGQKACRVKIDGCLIKDHKKIKCDFLFKVCPINKYHLVELKGTDVDHAVAQIVNTFDVINKQIKDNPLNFTGHIISSSIPRAAEQKFRTLKEKVLKNKRLNIEKQHFRSEFKV